MATNEALIEQLKQLLSSGEVDKLSQKLNKLTAEQLELLQNAAGVGDELRQIFVDAHEALTRNLNNLQEQRGVLEGQLATETSRWKQALLQEKLDKNLLEIAEEKKRIGEDLTRSEKDRLEIVQRIEKEQKDILAIIQKQFEASSKLTESFSLGSEYSAHTLFNMSELEGAISNLGKKGGLMKLLVAPLGLAEGVFKNLINSTIGLVFQIDEAESAFRKATGASREFAREATNVYEATRTLGVGLKEANAAFGALRSTYTDFTFQSEGQREEIGKTVAMLGELGVSMEDAAKGMQASTKMFGMSGTAAAKNARELNALAIDLQVAPQQIASDFAALSGQLAKLGPDATRSFKEMQRVMKITGFEAQKLIAITEKFDTFEGAAEMAGNLNAALGGNFVNAMDMMMETDPVARFETLRDTLLDAGLSFDSMSYYQRKFYAQSMGLESVGDLALMMSGNMNALDGDINRTSASYEEQAKIAADMLDATTKLKMIFIELVAVLTPVVDWMHKFFENHKEAIKFTADWTVKIGGAVLALKTLGRAIIALKGVGPWLLGFFRAAPVAAGAASTGMGILAGGITSVGAAASAVLPGLLGISAVIASIGVAAAGLGYLFGGIGKLFRGGDKTTKLSVSGEGMGELMETMSGKEDTMENIAKSFERIAVAITSTEKTLPRWTRMFQAATALEAVTAAFRPVMAATTTPSAAAATLTPQTITIPIYIGDEHLENRIIEIANGEIIKHETQNLGYSVR